MKLPIASTTKDGILTNASQNMAGAKTFYNAAGSTVLGSYSDAGAWTLGPTTGSVQHLIRSGSTTLKIEGTAAQSVIMLRSNGGSGTAIQFQDGLAIGDSGGIGHITTVNRFQARCGGSGGAELLNGATTWTAISDIRYKKDIIPLNYGLSEIAALETIKYRLLDDDNDRKYRLGFKAQQAQLYIPELVDESSDMDGSTKMFLNSTDMIPVLVKALQELKQQFDEYVATHP